MVKAQFEELSTTQRS